MLSNLNEIQKKAVYTIDTNLSLKAGAGTGKTKVITERFLNILENGNLSAGREFDEVLAITFTNKASDEMRGRILKELSTRKNEDKFKNLYKYFSKANIYTIHGFCTNIIKENPLIAKVDPNFEVSDERMSNLLLKESVDLVLEKEIENEDLIEFLIKREDVNLTSLSKDLSFLYKDIRNNGYRIEDLKKYHKDYVDSIELGDFSKLFEFLDEYEKVVTGTKFKKLIKSDEYIDFVNNPSLDYLQNISDSLGTGKSPEQESLREKINREILFLSQGLELTIEKYYILVFNLLEKIEEVYIKKKKEKSLLDYSDLQFIALDVIKKVDNYNYKYIMIDEFQDTDRLQVEIFTYLSNLSKGKANIFVVGDPKQSIYGFRGSNLEEYYNFTDKIKESKGKELVMKENYRSSPSLIESFNEIFKNLLKKDYDPLVASAKFSEENILNIEVIRSDEFGIEIKDEKKKEAVFVANKVLDLINRGENPSEIAILFRRKAYISLFEEELLKLNIRVNNTAQDFVGKREIKDILIFLKAISNKRDFLSLLSYLRSPIVGLNDNSIVIIAKYFNREEYYIEDEYLKLLDENEEDLFRDGFNKLLKIKKLKPLLSLKDFIKESIKISDYYEIAGMLYGLSASKNLDKLLNLAEDFENKISANLFEFIEYLEESEVNVEEEENAVNLLTIHKSKGLEFENVIIAEMDNSFNIKSKNNFFEYSNIGLGIKFNDINSKYNLISNEKKEKSLEEEIRMFYVATTRAKKRLILSLVNIEENKIYNNTYYDLFLKSNFKNVIISPMEIRESNGINKILLSDDFINTKEKFKEKSIIRNNYINKTKKVRYYSATSYMAFKRSKEEYFRKYILGEDIINPSNYAVESKILDPIIRGNIVHAYAELNPKNIDEFIRNSLRNYGVLESIENINLLKEQFKNYELSLKEEVIGREVEFYYPITNGVIHGVIDQIRRDEDDNISIIDFKTSYNSDEELRKYYYPQLQIYTLAFEKISGKKVKEAKLLFLSNNEEFNVDISEKSIKETIKDFEEYINFVENHNELKDYID